MLAKHPARPEPPASIRVALLGAQGTGKTALAQAIAAVLQTRGQSTHCTAEVPQPWRVHHDVPPQGHAQVILAHTQARRVLQAPACNVLLADTTPLLTAIYSDLLLADHSLYPYALAHHAMYDLTLVTGLDLPWTRDDCERIDRVLQQQVDSRLREVLQREGLGYSVVYGRGSQRSACALTAIDQHAQQRAHGPPRPRPDDVRWQWVCEKCSDAQCEHQLFSRLLAQDPSRAS